jgi:hypothetical protein
MVSYVHVVCVTCCFCYMFLIYIGVYPHKYIGHENNVQTGGVVRVKLGYMLFKVEPEMS